MQHILPILTEKLFGLLVARRGAAFGIHYIRLILLFSLLLSGTVPQGMMRAVGKDGVELILCIPEGTKQVWLKSNGEINDEAPAPDKPHPFSRCLSVTLAMVGVQTWLGPLAEPAHFAAFRPDTTDPQIVRAVITTAHRPRGPPTPI